MSTDAFPSRRVRSAAHAFTLCVAAGWCGMAEAQQADDVIDEIVVTGYRLSLRAALDQKRDSAGAVDVIVAEDIADFPDLNLAEALQRIPGVAITRAGGEGRQVSVRGLGPAFTTTRINGMEALSTGGFTDALGGNNRSRGFDFNAFDSELFNRLAVYKTSYAELEEGGLGATVDLRTARPFDFSGFTMAASGQVGYNDRSEEFDPRGAFLVSNLFGDGTFGALFSVAMSRRNILDEGHSTVRWSSSENFGSVDGVPLVPANDPDHPVNQAWHPRIPRIDSYIQETKRLGLSGALQWRPSDRTSVNLDALYSKSDTTREENFMQIALNNVTAVNNTNISNYVIRNDAIVSADLSNARLLSERRYDELEVEFTQFVLSLDQDLTDTLRLSALAGKAESVFDNPIQRYVILQKNGDVSYDFSGNGGGSMSFGPQASDLDGWTVSNLRKRQPYTKNELDVAELKLAWDFHDKMTLKGGASRKVYDFNTSQAFMANEGNNGIVGVIDPGLLTTYRSGSFGSWAAPNQNEFNSQFGFFANEGPFLTSTDFRPQDSFAVREETDGLFVQLDFEFEAGIPWRGNIGARYFETKQRSTGISNINNPPVVAQVKYDDTLPSLNLVGSLRDDLLLRFGYSQVINRPGMPLLRPVSSVSVAGSNRTVNGNNPGIGPTTADAYDLALEWYFAEESLLALALFRKDIDSFVQTISRNIPFTQTGLPIQQAIDACNASAFGYGPDCNENLDWNVNAPGNSPGGKLDGFEISYQQPFSFLPGGWSNLGLIANHTYVDSKIDYLGVVAGQTVVVRPNETLVNLSKNTSNLTLYYDDGTFSARISMADRSDYLTNVPGRNGTYVERTKGTTNIDAAASYRITEQLRITFEALNLTDEPENQRLDATESPADVMSYFHQTGRQYYLGLRYTF